MVSDSDLHGLRNSHIFAKILRKQKIINHQSPILATFLLHAENLGAEVIFTDIIRKGF